MLSASQHLLGRDQRLDGYYNFYNFYYNLVLLPIGGGFDKFDILPLVFGFMT